MNQVTKLASIFGLSLAFANCGGANHNSNLNSKNLPQSSTIQSPFPAVVPGGYSYEGVAWTAPVRGTPVYRLNKAGDDHFYTTNQREVSYAQSLGYVYEGIAFQSGGSVPVYRLNNTGNGDHFYTTSTAEVSSASRIGYEYEGIAFYAIAAGAAEVQGRSINIHRFNNSNIGDHFYSTTGR